MNISGSKSEPDAERVKIAGFRRVTFIIVLAPIIFVIAAGTYLVIRDAISVFPDRRPVLLFYEISFAGVLVFGMPLVFRRMYPLMVGVIAGAPALFIEDGYLIYGSKDYFCIPVKDADVALTPGDNLFRKVILSAKGGRRTEIGLLAFDKSGPEIIEAVNANR